MSSGAHLDTAFELLNNTLQQLRPTWHEAAFQADIGKLFMKWHIRCEREVSCEGGKVDFVVDMESFGLFAVEVKTQGTQSAAIRQLTSYLEDDRFVAGILVTTKPWKLDREMASHEKPIRIISSWKNAL